MVTNIPTSIPAVQMTKHIRDIFSSLFAPEKVLMTRVSPILTELYQMALQLRKTKKKYRYTKYQNKARELSAVTLGTKYERVKKYRKEGGLFKVKL